MLEVESAFFYQRTFQDDKSKGDSLSAIYLTPKHSHWPSDGLKLMGRKCSGLFGARAGVIWCESDVVDPLSKSPLCGALDITPL